MVQGQGTKPHLVRLWRMRGTMLAGGPALAKNGCFSSSAAVARCAGSRTSRRSRKPFRDGDTCGGGRAGSECRLHCSLAVGASVASCQWADIYCPGQEERCPVSRAWPHRLTSSLFSKFGEELAAAGPWRHPSPQTALPERPLSRAFSQASMSTSVG